MIMQTKGLLLVLLLILTQKILIAQTLGENKIEFSASGGFFFPGNVQGSYESDFPPDLSVTVRNSLSPLLKLTGDYFLTSNFSVGLNLNYAAYYISDILYKDQSLKFGNEVNLGRWDGIDHIIKLDDISMLEINSSFKWRFILNERMVLRPALYVGYRQTFSESPWSRERGVVINYNLEYQFFFTDQLFALADLGFFSQAYGGVKHIGYLRTLGVPYFTLGIGMAILQKDQ